MTTETKPSSETPTHPPTAAEARQWYQQGWIDDDGLDQLLETAFEEYGDSGEPAGTITSPTRGHVAGVDTHPPVGLLLAIGAGFGVVMTLAVVVAFPELLEWLFNWEIHRLTPEGAVPL